MALKQQLSTEYGIDLPEAYSKIVSGEWDNTTIVILVHTFSSQSAREKNAVPIRENRYLIERDADSLDNPIVSGYKYLKTLPEFANAVDC